MGAVGLQRVSYVFCGRYAETECGEAGDIDHGGLHQTVFAIDILAEITGYDYAGEQEQAIAQAVAADGPE